MRSVAARVASRLKFSSLLPLVGEGRYSSLGRDRHQARRRNIVFVAGGEIVETGEFEAGGFDRRAHVRSTVRVTNPLAEQNALAVMRLRGEGEETARRQHACGLQKYRREIGDVNHGIRCE